MITLGFQSADELDAYIATLGNGYLFRGQVREYLDSNGTPKLSTSFSRKQCIPPLMLKWFFYSGLLLRQYVRGFDDVPDPAVDQAILQHYGWRSFFVDATSRPEVACWFAAHQYTSKLNINLTEDCWEDPAWLIHEKATYQDHEGTRVLYAISRKALRAKNIQAVNLDEIVTKHATARYAVQSGWLVGPLDELLPPECVAMRLYAPSSVFKELAARAGLGEQSDLFPSPKDDPILRSLLSLPFVHRRIEKDPPPFKVFDRSLPLPEYGWTPVKRHSGAVAFYFPFWLANEQRRMPLEDCFAFVLCEEACFFGMDAHADLNFPMITKVVRQFRGVAFETDNAIYYSGENNFGAYGKGVYLKLMDDDTICVHEIILEQAGMRPSDVGIARGWRFRVTKGRWIRIKDADDCPCGNDAVHLRHLTFLSNVEAFWAKGDIIEVRNGVYCRKGIDPGLDLSEVEFDDDERAA